MLQRKRKSKKILAFCLSAVLMMSSLMFTAFANSAEDATSYLSSEYFVNDKYTMEWDNGIWVPQTYDPATDTYINMNIKVADRGARSKDGNAAYAAYSGVHSSNSPNVSAWWMAPASTLGTSGSLTDFTYSAVKTFVVPKAGDVLVSFGEQFLSKSGATEARIVLTSNSKNEQVWPKSGYYTVAIDSTEIPDAISLSVKKGDRIRFEIKRPADKSTGDYWSKTYWDPVINYIGDVYKSSDNFTSGNTDGKWDNGIWSAQKFDGTTYIALTNSASKDGRNEAASAAAQVYYGINVNNSPNVNQWWVAPGVNRIDWTADAACAGVKTFTAPKAGFVEVTFAKGLYTYNSTTDARITVTKTDGTTTQVWPESGYHSVVKSAGGKITDEIKLTVNRGDKINFEISIPENTSGSFYTKVYCDPTITYIQPYTESEVTVTQTGVEVDAQIVGLTKSSIIIVAGYDVDGNLEDFETFTGTYLENPVTLTGDVKNVKIMVWNSLEELVPISVAETIAENNFITQ